MKSWELDAEHGAIKSAYRNFAMKYHDKIQTTLAATARSREYRKLMTLTKESDPEDMLAGVI
jgi:curved DNA-binding protein CbpA